uniref:Uncharacterized protein n=1 Tax=viral metagenome TaxID=1070528 RepID=A0A6C0CM05_9ZZZZ
MKTNIIVIDDFHDTPDVYRNFILMQDFNVTGNFPGARTESYATKSDKERFEKIMGKKITYWPTEYNGSYQYTLAEHDSWVHRDCTDYSALIFLTPDAPLDAGTAIFRHKSTGLLEIREDTSEEDKKQLDADSNDIDKWELVDYVGNKYNRCVIFNGRFNHRSMKYFGDSKETGRLFQTFFFNCEE